MLNTATPLERDRDYFTEDGAYALARVIRNYWQLRGLAPKVWVAKTLVSASPADAGRFIFLVRSDMKGGRPT